MHVLSKKITNTLFIFTNLPFLFSCMHIKSEYNKSIGLDTCRIINRHTRERARTHIHTNVQTDNIHSFYCKNAYKLEKVVII